MASGGISAMSGEGGFFILAATVLCCYEHAITFSEEVRCVWRKRISAAKVLFILNRYLVLAVSLVSIVEVLPLVYPPYLAMKMADFDPTSIFGEVCSVSVRFVDGCLIVINLAYAVFAALRMYALYGLSKRVFLWVFLVGIINPLAQIWLMLIEATSPLALQAPVGISSVVGRVNCNHIVEGWLTFVLPNSGASETFILTGLRFHALCFESMLIALTWKKTLYRFNVQPTAMRTPFTTILLTDGTFYFVVVAVATALNGIALMLYFVTSDETVYSSYGVWVLTMTGPLVDALTSICMSRFILGLLSISLDEGSSQLRTSQWKTLHFATIAETFAGDVAVLGDESMGGHLDADELVGEPTNALEAGAASGGVVDIA